jgi:DNA-binding CsgD family transcriptional regulator
VHKGNVFYVGGYVTTCPIYVVDQKPLIYTLMNTLNRPLEFLQAVLESFVDGILVLTEQKEQKYANQMALQLCQQLAGKSSVVPQEVWKVCEALIGSRELYPDQAVVVESEVECQDAKLRIRAQWLNGEGVEPRCLLIRLQDENQTIQGLAIAEAQSWGLTQRETEVWVRRRAGCHRKQIAEELFIALDTVKKHLKNIQTKRQIYLDEHEWLVSTENSSSQTFYSAAFCN